MLYNECKFIILFHKNAFVIDEHGPVRITVMGDTECRVTSRTSAASPSRPSHAYR